MPHTHTFSSLSTVALWLPPPVQLHGHQSLDRNLPVPLPLQAHLYMSLSPNGLLSWSNWFSSLALISCVDQVMCYDCALWTIIFFPSIPLSPSPLLWYYGHPPFAPCYGLELDLLSNTKTGTRCLADCAPPSPIYYMPYPHSYCNTYVCISACWCAPFVPLLCPPLLIVALCIIAPFVHATRPPYMCNTMPLVRVLVV